MGKLDGKVALITGGTSGIGEAIVSLFAEEGAMVVFSGRNEKRGNEHEKQNCSLGFNTKFLECDVTKQEDIMNLKSRIVSDYGRLDVLVNCAGIWRTARLNEITYEDYELIFKTNFASVVFMTQAFMDMLEENEGNIVNVSSVGGLQSHIAGRSQFLYASSKAAVIEFSQLCALNYAKKVRVNCLCPGPTDTPIFLNRDFSWVENQVPMGRLGMPLESARAALFLASSDASFINGAILTVDGGASIR